MNLEAESRKKREVVVLGLAGACGDEMPVPKEAEVDKVAPAVVELGFQGPDIGVVFKVRLFPPLFLFLYSSIFFFDPMVFGSCPLISLVFRPKSRCFRLKDRFFDTQSAGVMKDLVLFSDPKRKVPSFRYFSLLCHFRLNFFGVQIL